MPWTVQRQPRSKGHYYSAVYTDQRKHRRCVTVGFLPDSPATAELTARLRAGDPLGQWKERVICAVLAAADEKAAIRQALIGPALEPLVFVRGTMEPAMSASIQAHAVLDTSPPGPFSLRKPSMDGWPDPSINADFGARQHEPMLSDTARLTASNSARAPRHPQGAMALRDYVADIWGPIREEKAATWKREFWWWDRQILPALGGVRLCDLDRDKWNYFLSGLHQGGRSKALAQTAYRCAITHAAALGWVEKVHDFRPIAGSTATSLPEPEPLCLAEVSRFLAAAPTPVHRALFATHFGQGLRPGEVLRVRWEDVDWKKRTLGVRGTKNKLALATVPLTPLTFRELHAWWQQLGEPREGVAFERSRGGGAFPDYPKKAFNTAAERSGLNAGRSRHLFPYVARHSFATIAAETGIDRAHTKKMLRHSRVSTVLEDAYERVSQEQTARAFGGFDSR